MIFRNRRRTNAPFRNLFRSRRTRRIFVLHQHSHNPDTSTPDRRSRFESIPRTLACTLRTDTRRWASNMFFPPRVPEGLRRFGASGEVGRFYVHKLETRGAICFLRKRESGIRSCQAKTTSRRRPSVPVAPRRMGTIPVSRRGVPAHRNAFSPA